MSQHGRGEDLRHSPTLWMEFREYAVQCVFNLVIRLSMNRPAINGPSQSPLLLAGERFVPLPLLSG